MLQPEGIRKLIVDVIHTSPFWFGDKRRKGAATRVGDSVVVLDTMCMLTMCWVGISDNRVSLTRDTAAPLCIRSISHWIDDEWVC